MPVPERRLDRAAWFPHQDLPAGERSCPQRHSRTMARIATKKRRVRHQWTIAPGDA